MSLWVEVNRMVYDGRKSLAEGQDLTPEIKTSDRLALIL